MSTPSSLASDAALARVAARFGLSDDEAASILPPDTPEVAAFCARWGLTPALLWGLVIDAAKLDLGFGYRWASQGIPGKFGPLSFENERGYLAAMLRAFATMLTTLGQPLSVEMFRELRDQATHGVLREGGKPFEPGYVRWICRYGFMWNRDGTAPQLPSISREAWQQLFEQRLLYVPYPKWVDRAAADLWRPGTRQDHIARLSRQRSGAYKVVPCWRSRRGPALEAEAREAVDARIRAWNAECAAAGADQRAQLAAIARLCRALEMQHPFVDGNARALYFLLLPKLLLERGLPPTVIGTPFIFDGYYSDREMVALIVKGFQNFRRFRDAYSAG